MIETFVDSVLIIDDVEKEVEQLIKLLDEKQIWNKHFLPKDLLDGNKILRNRKLIFLDLYINEAEDKVEEQLALIRKMFSVAIGKDFGTYGIILWTKHEEEFQTFLVKFYNNHDAYQLPIFAVCLDKNKYIKMGNYNSVLDDLQAKLEENPSSSFFMRWDSLVTHGKNKTVENIYRLVRDVENQQEDLKYILLKLAQNYTGIPDDKIDDYDLDQDAVKAFSDMLHYDIANNKDIATASKLFTKGTTYKFSGNADDELIMYSQINSKLLVDFNNISQAVVIPGNIYKIKDENIIVAIEDVPEGATRIALEITPPCDYANPKKKKKSRAVGGFIIDYDKKLIEKYKADYYYKELYPIKLEGIEKPQFIIFDFRYFSSVEDSDLKDKNKFEIFFRAKDKLFADILQKLSSHTARLGLPIIR